MGTQSQIAGQDASRHMAAASVVEVPFRLSPDFEIEARPEHSHTLIAQLYSSLRNWDKPSPMVLRADPRRAGFFDIELEGQVFFVYIPPTGERVLLLATWLRRDAEAMQRVAG